MKFNEYQEKAHEFALYNDPMYPVASLMVESAELADLFIKPCLRGDLCGIDAEKVKAEAGDVLWNLANILKDYGIRLEDVAEANIAKLTDRKERGVIQGSGDNR